jgi:hypothetical protein
MNNSFYFCRDIVIRTDWIEVDREAMHDLLLKKWLHDAVNFHKIIHPQT